MFSELHHLILSVDEATANQILKMKTLFCLLVICLAGALGYGYAGYSGHGGYGGWGAGAYSAGYPAVGAGWGGYAGVPVARSWGYNGGYTGHSGHGDGWPGYNAGWGAWKKH